MNEIDAAVQALVQARRSGRSAAAVALPDSAAAYAVQARVAAVLGWFSEGAAACHWKSGGPSRGAEMTHARLPPAGVWEQPGRCACLRGDDRRRAGANLPRHALDGRPGLRAARLAAPCHARRRLLRAGSVVTTGTWCGLPLAAAGDRVTAEFAGIGRVSVQL